jgi:hypothetical protein
MRKTIAMTALTVGMLFVSSGYAAQTVVVARNCGGCGNFSGNVVRSNNRVSVNVNVVSRSFNGNSILSHNNTSLSVVSGSGNSFSGSITIP